MILPHFEDLLALRKGSMIKDSPTSRSQLRAPRGWGGGALWERCQPTLQTTRIDNEIKRIINTRVSVYQSILSCLSGVIAFRPIAVQFPKPVCVLPLTSKEQAGCIKPLRPLHAPRTGTLPQRESTLISDRTQSFVPTS